MLLSSVSSSSFTLLLVLFVSSCFPVTAVLESFVCAVAGVGVCLLRSCTVTDSVQFAVAVGDNEYLSVDALVISAPASFRTTPIKISAAMVHSDFSMLLCVCCCRVVRGKNPRLVYAEMTEPEVHPHPSSCSIPPPLPPRSSS